ncbi:hypothetical protein [Nocardia brasiliensis]|nr:hypothetical protein [Nocardia brasiliensis]
MSSERTPKVLLPRGYPGSGKSSLFAKLKAENPRLGPRGAAETARTPLG